MRALIVEFGGNHSETIGFFAEAMQNIDIETFVYFEGDTISNSFLPSIPKKKLHIIKTFTELETTLTDQNLQFVIFNSARNLRRGRSRAVSILQKLFATGFPEERIIIQCHARGDTDLDFVANFRTQKIAPTPLFAESVSEHFLPVYNALTTPGIVERITSVLLRTITLGANVTKIGGLENHSEGAVNFEILEEAIENSQTLKASLFTRSNLFTNFDCHGLLSKQNVSIFVGKTDREIERHLRRRRSLVWSVNNSNGIYCKRILTGSLPFGINFKYPVLLDPDTYKIYKISDLPEIIIRGPDDLLRFNNAITFYRTNAKWKKFSEAQIKFNQDKFASFIKDLRS